MVVAKRKKEEGNGRSKEEMGMATFLGGTTIIFWADIWLLRKTRKTGHRADVDGLSRSEWEGNFIIKAELEIRTRLGGTSTGSDGLRTTRNVDGVGKHSKEKRTRRGRGG